MANHYSVYQFRDKSGELSNTKMFNGAITSVSIAGFLTAFGGMRAALEAITLGVVSQESWVGDLTVLSAALPASDLAQRESKWLVRYHDTITNKKYQLEIPTADINGRLLPLSDFGDPANPEIAAFITAFNAFARGPDSDVNAVAFDSIQHVGRNL